MVAEFRPEYGKPIADEDLVDYFWKCYDQSSDHSSQWRDSLPSRYKMYGGKTYSPADRKWLDVTKRPVAEMNLVLGQVNAVVGSYAADRQEIEFQPVEPDNPIDAFKAQIMTQLVQSLARRSSAMAHDMKAMFNMSVTGYGFTEVYLDTQRIPSLPSLRSVPPWEMYWDPAALADNLADGRYLIRRREMSLEDAQARWPSRAEELKALHSDASVGTYSPNPVAGGRWADRAGGRIPIYEFQYRRSEPRIFYTDPVTEQGRSVDVQEFEALQEVFGKDNLSHVEYAAMVFYRSFLATNLSTDGKKRRGEILRNGRLAFDRFTIPALTGYSEYDPDKGEQLNFGVLETVADLQRYINRTATTILEMMARATKAGGRIEKSALGERTIEQWTREQSTPGMWSVVEDGANQNNAIVDTPMGAYPNGLERFFSFMVSMFPEITGISSILRGTATGERSQSLVSNLQNQALTVSMAHVIANMEGYLAERGRLLARIALTEAPPKDIERLIGHLEMEGITFESTQGPDGQPMQQPMLSESGQPVTAYSLVRDEDPLAYDVSAEIGAYSPSARAAFWATLDQHGFLKGVLQSQAAVILPELFEMGPFPATVAQKIVRKLQGVQQQQAQVRSVEDFRNVMLQMPPEQRMEVLSGLAQEFLQPPS